MSPSRKQLLAAAKAFCDAFSRKEEISTSSPIFRQHTQCQRLNMVIQSWLPSWGKHFRDSQEFEHFVVDSEGCKIALKGKGTFTWVSTGESWDETFAWMLDFDDEGRVTEYQVWADSGSAYLARIGKLREVKMGTSGGEN
ncbi:hypothetical protein BD779DRAFT_357420 [Infundibulicybe gibba]|nr:hypothetical protein BD779DRAFT_357420 [Infundibulicybe gibba]